MPILFMILPMLKEARDSQLRNAYWPISVVGRPVTGASPKVNEASLVQFANDKSPIFVTELGMITDESRVQLEKALLPMLVTELGIVIRVSPAQ